MLFTAKANVISTYLWKYIFLKQDWMVDWLVGGRAYQNFVGLFNAEFNF